MNLGTLKEAALNIGLLTTGLSMVVLLYFAVWMTPLWLLTRVCLALFLALWIFAFGRCGYVALANEIRSEGGNENDRF